jgi:hypothetical protein
MLHILKVLCLKLHGKQHLAVQVVPGPKVLVCFLKGGCGVRNHLVVSDGERRDDDVLRGRWCAFPSLPEPLPEGCRHTEETETEELKEGNCVRRSDVDHAERAALIAPTETVVSGGEILLAASPALVPFQATRSAMISVPTALHIQTQCRRPVTRVTAVTR